MQIIFVKDLLCNEGFAARRGTKTPSHDRVNCVAVKLGRSEAGSELAVFTPSDLSLSASEDMKSILSHKGTMSPILGDSHF